MCGDVRCLLKCPGSRSVALVGRGNDRGTKEFMCKRCFFFFFYILAEVTVFTVCLERFDTHTKGSDRLFQMSLFLSREGLDLSLTVQEKVNKAFKSLIRLNHGDREGNV